MLRDHLVERVVSPLAECQEANGGDNPTPEAGVRLSNGTIWPIADWIAGIVNFPNENLACALNISLGRIDAGIILVCKLALQRLKRLLKHRRMAPMRAKRLDAWIPIGAHVDSLMMFSASLIRTSPDMSFGSSKSRVLASVPTCTEFDPMRCRSGVITSSNLARSSGGLQGTANRYTLLRLSPGTAASVFIPVSPRV